MRTTLALVLIASTLLGACKLSLGSLTGGSSTPSSGATSTGNGERLQGGNAEPQASTDEPAPAGLPAFCPRPRSSGPHMEQLQERFADVEDRLSFDFFRELHVSMCNPDKPEWVAPGMQMRAAIMKELRLTDADVAEIKVAVGMDFREGTIGFDWTPPGSAGAKGLLTADPMEQARAVAGAFSYHPMRGFWIADALGDRMTELARARLVRGCLRADDLILAACLADAHALNRDRLWKELQDPVFKPDVRLDIKFSFLALQRQVAAKDKELAARAAEDPAWKTVYTDVPKAEAKAWAAVDPALLALARELDFAGLEDSRKAMAGCQEKVQPFLTKLVKGLQVKDQSLVDPAGTPTGYATLAAVYSCARNGDNDWAGWSSQVGHYLTAGAWRRGPRTGTVEMLLAQAGNLKFDKKGVDLSDGMPRDGHRALEAFNVSDGNEGERAIVKKVTPRGATALITFVDGEMDVLTCDKWAKTGTWTYDRKTGEIYPTERCVKFGSVKEKVTIASISVPASLLAGIAPGRMLQFKRNDKGQSAPILVWDSAQQKQLVAAFGVVR
jgi:hypothetical protein